MKISVVLILIVVDNGLVLVEYKLGMDKEG